MENTEKRRKCNGGYEKKKTAEEIARKRTDRDPGRQLALLLAPATLGAGAGVEVVETKIGVEVEAGIVDIESLEMDATVDGVAVVVSDRNGPELGGGTDVDSVPTVTVCVPDEVRDFVNDEGMGIDDVAASRGESNDPDIPVNLT